MLHLMDNGKYLLDFYSNSKKPSMIHLVDTEVVAQREKKKELLGVISIIK